MKKNLITLLSAGLMLVSGVGVAAPAATAHAATTNNSGSTLRIKRRSVNAVIKDDKPKLIACDASTGKFVKQIDSNYAKGQAIPVYFSIVATAQNGSGQNENVNLYFVNTQTIDGKNCMVFVPDSSVTVASAVPTYDQYSKQAQDDATAIQNAFKNRKITSFSVTPKSKKGSKIYYAYRTGKKSKKFVFKASKKKIKKGKTFKARGVVKNGKSRYVYIGKMNYLKWKSVKITNVKYSALDLPDDVKNLIVEN